MNETGDDNKSSLSENIQEVLTRWSTNEDLHLVQLDAPIFDQVIKHKFPEHVVVWNGALDCCQHFVYEALFPILYDNMFISLSIRLLVIGQQD